MGNGSSTLCYSSPIVLPLPLNITTCDPGWLCPNVTADNFFTLPSVCPPSVDCQLSRLGSQFCAPQGPYEPLLCPPGFYCPNSSLAEPLPCPAGTYCGRGAAAPSACAPFGAYCPAGTEKQRFYGGLVIAGVVDIVLAAAYVWWRYRGEPAAWARRRAASRFASSGAPGAAADGGDALGAALLKRDASFAALPREEEEGARAALEAGFTRANAGRTLAVSFTALSYTLPPPDGRTILSGVTGRIAPGRVTAVMGPSGAGKTTFLSVLSGKLTRSSGSVRINGTPDDLYRFKRITGFVPQDDVMLHELTVRENIAHAARVRLPRRGWPPAAVARHVDAVVEVLGLSGCADTLAGRVSGGQRKRTNIGMELAAAPAAIFLDEPTSGLDATAALEVCRTLRAIADLGLTVVAVIHQPRVEIFESFDDLLLLAPGGHTVYVGPQRRVLPYFRELGFDFRPDANPADDLLDFVAGRGVAAMEFLESRPPSSSALDASVAAILTREWAARAAAADAGGGASASSSASASSLSSSSAGAGAGAGGEASASPGAMLAFDGAAGGVGAGGAGGGGVNDASDDASAAFDPASLAAQRGASLPVQFALCFSRSLLQQYRTVSSLALEMGVGIMTGGIMGAAATAAPQLYVGVLRPPYTLLSPSPIETLLPSIGLYIALAVGLAGSPAGVKTFGEEKELFYREAASGHSAVAYYAAKSLAVLPRFTLAALHFSAVFVVLAAPSTDFGTLTGLVWCQFFAVYGLAAMTSMVVARENAPLLGVIVSLIAGCMCGFGPSVKSFDEWGLRWAVNYSHARWANEAFFHAETLAYRPHFMVTEVSAPLFGYTLDRFAFDVWAMLLIGMAHRAVAFALLVGLNRDRQK